jgi:hypothetical protein
MCASAQDLEQYTAVVVRFEKHRLAGTTAANRAWRFHLDGRKKTCFIIQHQEATFACQRGHSSHRRSGSTWPPPRDCVSPRVVECSIRPLVWRTGSDTSMPGEAAVGRPTDCRAYQSLICRGGGMCNSRDSAGPRVRSGSHEVALTLCRTAMAAVHLAHCHFTAHAPDCVAVAAKTIATGHA